MRLMDHCQVIDWIGSGPVDLDTDRTGDYINVGDYRRGLLIFTDAAGTAGDDWNVTIRQATDSSGTSVKDADIVDEYFIKQAATNLLSTAQFTRTTQTADALISGNATSAEQVCLLCVELDFSRLDTNNAFNFIGLTVTLDASGGAQYGNAILILYEARHPQQTALGALS